MNKHPANQAVQWLRRNGTWIILVAATSFVGLLIFALGSIATSGFLTSEPRSLIGLLMVLVGAVIVVVGPVVAAQATGLRAWWMLTWMAVIASVVGVLSVFVSDWT